MNESQGGTPSRPPDIIDCGDMQDPLSQSRTSHSTGYARLQEPAHGAINATGRDGESVAVDVQSHIGHHGSVPADIPGLTPHDPLVYTEDGGSRLRGEPSVRGWLRDSKRRRFFLASVLALVVIGVVVIVITVKHNASHSDDDAAQVPLILISLDGFRWDYFSRTATTNFSSLINGTRGVQVQRMLPIFPSKTFPNHYTLVTGLYAESHGIVSNHMYDPVTNATFDMGKPNSLDSQWWLGISGLSKVAAHGCYSVRHTGAELRLANA